MKIRHLTYFIMLNFINQRAYFQRISYNFNEVLNNRNALFILGVCMSQQQGQSNEMPTFIMLAPPLLSIGMYCIQNKISKKLAILRGVIYDNNGFIFIFLM